MNGYEVEVHWYVLMNALSFIVLEKNTKTIKRERISRRLRSSFETVRKNGLDENLKYSQCF